MTFHFCSSKLCAVHHMFTFCIMLGVFFFFFFYTFASMMFNLLHSTASMCKYFKADAFSFRLIFDSNLMFVCVQSYFLSSHQVLGFT